MAGKDLSLKLTITADGKVAVQQLGDVADAADDVGESGERAGAQAAAGLDQLRSAAAAIGLAALAREFALLNAAAESQRLALTQLTGSADAAGDALTYLADLSDRLGVSALDLGEQFVGLAAATKGTALEGEATRDVFEAVVAAMAKLGKSSAETTRALAAIQQMASKGVVAAEEMRGQLGEALPGAMQALSSATGIAVEDLNQMLESGQLLAADVLPALADGLRQMTGEVERVDSLAASMGRFQNAMSRAFTEPGQNGLAEAFGRIIDVGTGAVNGLTAGMVTLGQNIGAVGAYATGVIPSWDDLTAALQENNAAGQAYIDGARDVQAQTALTAGALDELATSSLAAAQAYAQAADEATATVKTVKAAGDAAVAAAKAEQSRAVLLADEQALLAAKARTEEAAAEAGRRNAQAAADLAAVTRGRIETLDQEIGQLLAQATAEGAVSTQIQAGIDARTKQIEARQQELDVQDAQARKLADEALAQEAAARAAQVASQTYGDQSAQLDRLISQRDRLVKALKAEAEGSAEAVRLASELAIANALVADAARDAGAAIEEQAKANERALTIAQARLALAGDQVQQDIAAAKARGDLAEVSRLGLDQMELEAEALQAASEAKARDAELLAERARLKLIEAEATGEYTAAEQAAVAALRDGAELAGIESERMAVNAETKRDAAEATRVLAERQRVLAEEMEQAGVVGVRSMEDVRDAIRRLSDGDSLPLLARAIEDAFNRGAISAAEYSKLLDEIEQRQDAVAAKAKELESARTSADLASTAQAAGRDLSGLPAEQLRAAEEAYQRLLAANQEAINTQLARGLNVDRLLTNLLDQALASARTGTAASAGSGLGGNQTVNVSIGGVLDVSDPVSVDRLARKLAPVLSTISRRGA